MALNQAGKGSQLAYNDGTARTVTNVQAYDANPDQQEISEHRRGTALVATHYRGAKTATIQITSDDFAARALLSVGLRVTAVVLTIVAATEPDGSAVGDNLTVTMSEAVLTELSGWSHENTDDAPATWTATFTLSRDPSSGTDPTCVVAAVGS